MSKSKTKIAEQLKAKTAKTNETHLAERMKDVSRILKLSEEGLDTMAIASKVKVGVTYVAEVIAKGAAEMEVELRAGYGMGPKGTVTETGAVPEPETDSEAEKATPDATPLDNATETKEQKSARIKKEKQDAKDKKAADKAVTKTPVTPAVPKEKRTRENALIQALKESNGTGLTLEAIGARANEILSITRKSWTGTLGAMKRANEITYNKETKLYNIA